MPEILDPSKPPTHIAQTPAGYRRVEENARRTDALAKQAAEGVGPDGAAESFDRGKLNKVDNEIMGPLQGGPRSNSTDEFEFAEFEQRGACPVTSPEVGYRYLWSIKSGSDKISAHIQMTHNTLLQLGYELVQGKMFEAKELEGAAAAGGSTQRGWGDCVLYRIKVEQFAKLERYRQYLLDRQNNIEEAFEAYGMKYAARTGGNTAHGRRNDPLLQRTVYAGGNGQQVAFEREIRTGRVPGFKPGDELGGQG